MLSFRHGRHFDRFHLLGLRTRMALAATLMFTCVAGATPSAAGDYSHVCSTADGRFIMQDEELRARDDDGPSIPYATLGDTPLADRRGTCTSFAPWANDTAYAYRFYRYLRRVRFTVGDGDPVETVLLCELAASGLPAAANCDRDDETLNWTASLGTAPPPPPPVMPDPQSLGGTAVSLWDHNGSTMVLKADGAARVFAYETPRASLRRAGVREGTVLFDGRRVGSRYEGTARVFSATCGTLTFPVAGEVGPDERTVTVTGEITTRGPDCSAIGTRTETLVFTLK